jgi:polyisoprenoid-binding protein YceI
MTHYDASNADCVVFTFKEGLLSPIAHDLRLRVGHFSVEVDEATHAIVASFDANSLSVDTPMRDGVENPSALSTADKQKIEGQIRDDVLHSARYPKVEFRGRATPVNAGGGYDLEGELTLHGVTQPISAQTQLVAGRQQLELRLHQPDFGITPFRAMLGTLKIRADVTVRLAL